MTADSESLGHLGPLHVAGQGRLWSFGAERTVVIGRDVHCDVTLADRRVSRTHLALQPGPGGWVVKDLDSRNGTWVNGAARKQILLSPDDDLIIRVGDTDGPELLLRCRSSERATAHRQILIGRGPDCDVRLEDPLVSRQHALVKLGREAVLIDLGAFNGTYRNGRQLDAPVTLAPGDRVGIGHQTLAWDGHGLVEETPRAQSLDARHLTVTTGTGQVLLDDVSIKLPAGSLTAVIGPSGSGKSTLMGALTGLRPASHGRVCWAGRDLYDEYDQLRFQIGLVPQEDIVHRQLTVGRALRFAAELRLPPGTSRESRIEEVLDEVKLSEHKEQRIDSLSGGQLKRTSIALELLTAPQLLFLDEPTSGLDPGLDRQVMRGLRTLADGGRVVAVVTHSVLALDMCDRVLLLAPGGRVAFFGPPEKLLSFFAVEDYPTVFDVLDDPAWVQRYAESSTRAAFVGRTGSARILRPAEQVPPPKRRFPVHQLPTLVRRNLAVAAADRMFVVLLVAMPVVLAAMAHAFPGEAGLSMHASSSEPGEVRQRLLVLIIGAALMGAALSVRDLVAERPIYRREHAVGLHPAAYLTSKIVVLGGLVAAQSSLFTLLALWGIRVPDAALVLPSARLEIAAVVATVAVTMTIAALAVSAAARTVEQTMPALVALIMAQFVFCGGLFALAGRAGLEQVSWLLPARFGYAAGAATIGIQQSAAPGADALFRSTPEQWLLDMGALCLQDIVLIAVAALLLRRSVTRGGRR